MVALTNFTVLAERYDPAAICFDKRSFNSTDPGSATNKVTMIVPESSLAKLLALCLPLNPAERAQTIENDKDLESAYNAVATQGDSDVPANAEDEVDFHYVCFVKSHKTGHLYEMDGDRKGPVDRGMLGATEDVLGERALSIIRGFIARERGGNPNFSLLGLAPA